MKVSKYTKLGILIIFSIAVFIWGMNYLKGIDFFKKNTVYYALYDHIDGLVTSSAVMMNGYQVGQVKEINFSGRNDGSLLVTFSLEGDFKIPQGSEARIVSSDIMGTRSIKLLINPSDNYYSSYDTIPGSIEGDLKEQVSMQVLPLKNKAEQLLASLDSAITVVTYIFNAEARKNLSESFAHINQTILNLQQTSAQFNTLMQAESGNIQAIIGNLKQVSETLSGSSANFANIAENFSAISDSLAAVQLTAMMEDIVSSVNGLEQIIAKINNKEGSAGMLINDPQLYNNLTLVSQSLDNLLNDIRNNPKRYVHFSAFDLGKDVYISTREPEKQASSDYSFKVHLISSPTRLNTNLELFDNLPKVEEVEVSGVYNYLIGNTSNLEEIFELHKQAMHVFPDATIISFKNERQVKLEKALRKTNK
ncbi:MlaD family protein [Gaoshiqia sediminis]|uniref:MlaD family protein n=1 Tax=Gaoshiqia sediminis TaxID=2986998 RepID=A0AA41Y5I1_9BACT|nr:MlaD family protein [Gaoshiqia sediminis]MCW0482220.1 MlaD family protein [Gaoshiqia sediminis]